MGLSSRSWEQGALWLKRPKNTILKVQLGGEGIKKTRMLISFTGSKCVWTKTDGREVEGIGCAAASWCDDNPALERLEFSGWALKDGMDGFAPKFRMDFYKFYKVGILDLLIKLDNDAEYEEINMMLSEATKRLSKNPRTGRQFLNWTILSAGWTMNYKIGWGGRHTISMGVQSGGGHSSFQKSSKYFNQHRYKYGGGTKNVKTSYKARHY